MAHMHMNSDEQIPRFCDVLVIGGGPSGSSVAALSAREGLDVVLLEKAKHPRPQVGESIIPHFWKFADSLGIAKQVEDEGFLRKAGGIVVWDGKIRQVRFSDFGFTKRAGLHVERDIFDLLFLQHASHQGAQVFERVMVRGVDFPDRGGAVVSYADRRNGEFRDNIECRIVVDASGPSAVLASQFGSRRRVGGEGKFLGLWGYFDNALYLGSDRQVHGYDGLSTIPPVTFVSEFEDGWAWHIILRKNTSVGLVLNTDRLKGMSKKELEEYFISTCYSIPYLKDLLRPATIIENSISFRPDYSYYSDQVCGDHFFCIGDAAAFVDPIFSQGVTTGMYNAALCAWAISASFRNPGRKQFYLELYRSRLLQYYGFSRLLAFGDFGGEGIDPALVKKMVTSFPRNELELSLATSLTTNRSQNLLRMVEEARLLGKYGNALEAKLEEIPELKF